MAKEIDLIMFPAQAPAELKAAVDAHKINYNALVKASAAFQLANVTLATAKANVEKTSQAYAEQLAKWTPKGV
jgi:hypothetical protein